MLSVQPVSFSVNRIPFKGAEDTKDDLHYIYTKDQYESDKSKIEETLDAVNEVVESAGNSKFMRVFGKLASIGVASALGFVSLKYGAQGVIKFAKKGINGIKNFANKEGVKEAAKKVGEAAKEVKDKVKPIVEETAKKAEPKVEEAGKAVKGLFGRFVDWAKEKPVVQSVTGFVSKQFGRLKNFKIADKTISEHFKNLSDSGFVKNISSKISEFFDIIKTKIASFPEKVKGWFVPDEVTKVTKFEKFIANLFGVSGAVSGGITAVQTAAKEEA